MALSNNVLSEIFDECAGKIISGIELGLRFNEALTKNLSEKEMSLFFKAQYSNKGSAMTRIADDAVLRNKLIEAVGDGTVGQYRDTSGGNDVFINVNQLGFVLQKSEELKTLTVKYPDVISKRVDDAMAQAIKAARNYEPDINAGRLNLTPLPF